jgi:propionyl-CoA carboxylase beta chain
VPKVTLILRKAYGAAYVVMGSKHLHGDVNFALPTAEVAVLAPEQVVPVIHRDEIAKNDTEATRKKLVAEYREQFATPFQAAERGYIDEVISAEQARNRIVRAFKMLRDKRIPQLPRKHSNMPL